MVSPPPLAHVIILQMYSMKMPIALPPHSLTYGCGAGTGDHLDERAVVVLGVADDGVPHLFEPVVPIPASNVVDAPDLHSAGIDGDDEDQRADDLLPSRMAIHSEACPSIREVRISTLWKRPWVRLIALSSHRD